MDEPVCLLVTGAWAQAEVSGGYGWALLRMIAALLLVCVGAYFALVWVRRYLLRVKGRPGPIRVVDRCPLSARHSLWLIEVGGRALLLGSADGPGGAVTRLAELDPDTLTEAPEDPARSSSRRA